MANVRISDLPNGASEIRHTSLIEIELAGGGSRKVTIEEFLEFLGIRVNTLAGLGSPGSEQNFLAFGTNVRKTGEGAGAGTGCLLMAVDTTSWDTVDDGGVATT